MHPKLYALGLSSLGVCFVLFKAAFESVESISPQGCRMSYMSPSYLYQTAFDTSWTPFAKRYSLWLYREVGWQNNEVRRPRVFLYGPLWKYPPAKWRPRTIYSRQCRLLSPDPLHSLVRCASVLLRPIYHLPSICCKTTEASRLFFW